MATCTALHDWVVDEAPDGEEYTFCAQCGAILEEPYVDPDDAYDRFIEDMMV